MARNSEVNYLKGLVSNLDAVFKAHTPLYNRDLMVESVEIDGLPYVVVQISGFFKYRVQVVGSRLIPTEVWYRDDHVKKDILCEKVRRGLYKVLEGVGELPYPVGKLVFKVGKLGFVRSHSVKQLVNGEYEVRLGEYY